ncbi:MAG: hypothetical protein WC462_03760 [archaeon]
MKKSIFIILIGSIILFVLLSGCTQPSICGDNVCNGNETSQFSCNQKSDCTSTCGAGCVNVNWAETYHDPCDNFRGWYCSCVNNTCYTDGNPPKDSK